MIKKVPAFSNNKNLDNFSVTTDHPLLSIIIPAYNEEKRLPDSLDKILAWVKTTPYNVEILVVENGSDDHTTEVAELYARQFNNISVLHSAKGKGAAVREGILHGNGEYLFICDADLSMPIAEVMKFLQLGNMGCQIVIGSRQTPGATRYDEPIYRHIMGRVFNFLVQLMAVPNISDTQCGFKLFQREIACDIFSRQTIDGWTFDVEIMYIALRRGYKIAEVPINWYFNSDSRVSAIKDTWEMLGDLICIRINGWRSVYEQPHRVL